MKNQKTDRIKFLASRLNNLSKRKSEPIQHEQVRFATDIIMKEASSLNRSMLTRTDIKNIQYIIDAFKQDDGYFHAITDLQLERIERRLQSLDKISYMTQYEKGI